MLRIICSHGMDCSEAIGLLTRVQSQIRTRSTRRTNCWVMSAQGVLISLSSSCRPKRRTSFACSMTTARTCGPRIGAPIDITHCTLWLGLLYLEAPVALPFPGGRVRQSQRGSWGTNGALHAGVKPVFTGCEVAPNEVGAPQPSLHHVRVGRDTCCHQDAYSSVKWMRSYLAGRRPKRWPRRSNAWGRHVSS